MDDVDQVRSLGQSWFPPRVRCEFLYGSDTWVEVQTAWGYLLPVSMLVASVLCARYAIRHAVPGPSHRHRRWWRHLAAFTAYWALVALTLLGFIAMAWREETVLSVWPLLTVPVLSVWTFSFIGRSIAVSAPSHPAAPPVLDAGSSVR